MTQTVTFLTATQIADALGEPPRRVLYMIQKHRVRPVERVGLIRLFDERAVRVIRQGLYDIQVRRG